MQQIYQCCSSDIFSTNDYLIITDKIHANGVFTDPGFGRNLMEGMEKFSCTMVFICII